MYAVIRTGGKQYRVEQGQTLEVERVPAQVGETMDLVPVLFVDGAKVLAKPAELDQARVRAKVVEETKGPKIHGSTYKSKSNQRRRWGHRQRLSLLEITEVSAGTAARTSAVS
jgi:large subunit ribosomal protein L21